MMVIEVLLLSSNNWTVRAPALRSWLRCRSVNLVMATFTYSLNSSNPHFYIHSRGWTIHFHTCTILFSCNRRTLSTCAHNFLQLRKFLSYKKPLLKIRVIQLHHVPQFCSSIWKHNHLSSPWGIKWTTDGQQTGTIFLKYFKDARLD